MRLCSNASTKKSKTVNDRIGIPVIDAQHEGLFDTFSRLQQSKSDDVLSEVLTKLGHQIRHHFYTEEALMIGMGLPAEMLQEHVAAHEAILEEIADLHWQAMNGKKKTLDEVIPTVAGWVVRHLAEYDMSLKPYVG